MFRNAPQRTKTESQQAFQALVRIVVGQRESVSLLGICGRWCSRFSWCRAIPWLCRFERERAKLPCLNTWFTRQRVLSMFVGESIALSVAGGMLGVCGRDVADTLVDALTVQIGIPGGMKVTLPTMLASLLVAATVGFISGCLPHIPRRRTNIVEGLRHIG